MTDKEIIIDGVNVGQCKYLNTFSDCDGYHYYCDLANDIKNEYCEHYKDCYFKQLARKTAECEKYKHLFNELDKRVSISTKIFDCIVVSKIIKDIISKAKDGE